MYKHILISTDGSEVAQKGVDHGLSLAKNLGARITIVTVTEFFPLYTDPAMAGSFPDPVQLMAYETSQKQIADKLLAAVREVADGMGIAAETVHVPNAPPAEAIVETARSCGCDLIVMASHGRRGLGRLLLGSQTSEVLTHSPVPVLVVR